MHPLITVPEIATGLFLRIRLFVNSVILIMNQRECSECRAFIRISGGKYAKCGTTNLPLQNNKTEVSVRTTNISPNVSQINISSQSTLDAKAEDMEIKLEKILKLLKEVTQENKMLRSRNMELTTGQQQLEAQVTAMEK